LGATGLLEKIIVRLLKRLTRLGDLVQGEGTSKLSELDPDNLLRPLQAADFTYPIALGPRASLKGLILIECGECSPNSTRSPAMDSLSVWEYRFPSGKGGLKFLYP